MHYTIFFPSFFKSSPCVLVLSFDFYAQIMGRRQTKYARSQSGSEVKSVFGFLPWGSHYFKERYLFLGCFGRLHPLVFAFCYGFVLFVFLFRFQRKKTIKSKAFTGLERRVLSYYCYWQNNNNYCDSIPCVLYCLKAPDFCGPIIQRQRKIVC